MFLAIITGMKLFLFCLFYSLFVLAQDEMLISDQEYYRSTLAYYTELVQQHRAGKTLELEQFNRTFFPMPAPSTDDSLLRCNYQRPVGNCSPDTFYSWGPLEKMRKVKSNSSDSLRPWSKPLNGSQSIYMTHSPVATYCYGRLALRFKFRDYPLPGALNVGNMIESLTEWWLPSFGREQVVLSNLESVSFARPEHFDEIVAEITRRLEPNSRWHEGALYFSVLVVREPNLKKKLLQGCLPERHPTDERVLVENLVLFLEAIIGKTGWIHYNNCPQCTPQNHFETNWPTFYNPN